MSSHRYQKYTDETEARYHLHYEHGMPLADAMKCENPIQRHQEAHS